jgi:transcriptional regulator with XRE-family HTH domain
MTTTIPEGLVERSVTAADIVRTIAQRMSSMRAARRLSLQEVADSAGLTKSHIWELEQGRTANPTVTTVVAVSRAFGVSVDYLTGISSDQPAIHPEALRIACDIDRLLRKEPTNV